ncbi:MAG: hypothetical protein ACFFER_00855 [Candidatus Thorarchaeota archaeon]
MILQLTALGMFTKFSEVVRKMNSTLINEHIRNNTHIPKSAFGSIRDLIRTARQSSFKTQKDVVNFSGGLSLLQATRRGFLPTERAHKLVDFSSEMHWAVSYLLGLSIATFPRVRSLYDLLFRGATIIYQKDGSQKPFPQFGIKRIDTSQIQLEYEEPKPFIDAIYDQIAANPKEYIIQSHMSSGKTAFDETIIDSDVRITRNDTTHRSFASLCGFGQDIASRFFTDEEIDGYHHLKLDKGKLLSNRWIIDALRDSVGFADLLKETPTKSLSSRRASLLLEIYQKKTERFDWIPWDELREELIWHGLREDEVYQLETHAWKNPLNAQYNLFLLDGDIAIRTESGPSGGGGLLGKAEHGLVRIWRY